MKTITEFINEAGTMAGAEKRKYHIGKTKTNIIVFDKENVVVTSNFKDIKGAENYAKDFNKLTNSTNRFIAIDFDNLTDEMKEVINEYGEYVHN